MGLLSAAQNRQKWGKQITVWPLSFSNEDKLIQSFAVLIVKNKQLNCSLSK